MKKLLICYDSKATKDIAKSLQLIRPNTVLIEESKQTKEEESLLAHKMKCPLFICLKSKKKSLEVKISFGRNYGESILEYIQFIIESFTISDLPLNFGYVKVMCGLNPREENLFGDIFNTFVGSICIDNIDHCLALEDGQQDSENFVFKLYNFKKEEDLVIFNLKRTEQFYCDEDEFIEACGAIQKKRKNIKENEMLDKIGRIHLEKQDLKEIRLKKSKGFKREV